MQLQHQRALEAQQYQALNHAWQSMQTPHGPPLPLHDGQQHERKDASTSQALLDQLHGHHAQASRQQKRLPAPQTLRPHQVVRGRAHNIALNKGIMCVGCQWVVSL